MLQRTDYESTLSVALQDLKALGGAMDGGSAGLVMKSSLIFGLDVDFEQAHGIKPNEAGWYRSNPLLPAVE